MPVPITPDQLAHALAVPDLTDDGQGRHAVLLVVEAAVRAVAEAWACEVRWCRGPRVVPVEDNYDNLLFGAEAASRDSRYSRYVDDRRMLRSHASAMVPPALRRLADAPGDDVLLVCPGIVFRRDAIDRLHTGTPHQLDLWRISGEPLGRQELDDMVGLLLAALVPGAPARTEGRVHPYTVDGRQVDVDAGDGWVEVWECGLAHPGVLARAGLAGRSGLALGMGLDRLVMLRKGVPDIRLLRSPEPGVSQQMTDLSPYRPVSSLPAVRRDLSIVVDRDDLVEDIGDRVRASLGEHADAVEEVAQLAQTPYEDLPRRAVDRMGMSASQKNVLVRLTLRPLERTLTDGEANALRDRVYAALHQGGAHEWSQPEGRPAS